MTPLADEDALELLGRCADPQRTHGYRWEAIAIEHLEWSGERPAINLLRLASYRIVFDLNPQLMPTRVRAGLHFGCDEAPLGYQLTREELLAFHRQPWACYTDFYVFGPDGALCALRTHEDPEPDYGFWLPRRPA